MSKSNKELAVEIYCAKMIADAIASGKVVDPRDEAAIIRQIAASLESEFDD